MPPLDVCGWLEASVGLLGDAPLGYYLALNELAVFRGSSAHRADLALFLV